MKTRRRLWEILDVAKPGDRSSLAIDTFILLLIALNVFAVILESVEFLRNAYAPLFRAFEVFSILVFTVEYIGRLWSCVENKRYARPIWGRIQYALRFMTLIDLMSFLPSYLPLLGLDLRFIRILRMFRIIRIFKIGRYYASLTLIKNVLLSRKEELVLTTVLMFTLLVISSCVMFFCENAAQPDVFSNIPATMWWAVSTLTTVGYGDAYPITPIGKICGALIAILGIGMFALPTGILGSGFIEEIQTRKSRASMVCPHCGKPINHTHGR